MKHLLTILIALLTCATSFAQSVIVKGTGAGAVLATGAGSVRGVAHYKTTYSSGRFTIYDANTNVVVDNSNGVVWVRSPPLTNLAWQAAIDWCSALPYADYSDWRSPSVADWTSLMAYTTNTYPKLPTGHPFIGVVSNDMFWTSSAAELDAYAILIGTGDTSWQFRHVLFNVWPCRGP